MMIEIALAALLAQDPKEEALKPEKAEELFVQAYKDYLAQDLSGSTSIYEKILKDFSKEPIGAIAAYNVACNYGLSDDAAKALEWLRKAVEAGYDNADHLDGDSDLEAARELEGYSKIVDKARENAKAGRAPIKPEQVVKFAERLAAAAKNEDSEEKSALCSRLGWFSHKATVDALNVELKKKGYQLVNQDGAWDLQRSEDY